MKALRTPDERFQNLPGYNFAPHYAEIPDGEGGTLRVHYIDEGPRDAAPILLMHGEPSWCYLYRKMIPILVAAGHRAIAPDLVGFGRSDKPDKRTDYTYQRHVDWMTSFIEAIDLQHATLVGQDWGGLIGLRLAAEHPSASPTSSPRTPSCRPATARPARRSCAGSSSRRRPRRSTSDAS